jgi:hypothetical protein
MWWILSGLHQRDQLVGALTGPTCNEFLRQYEEALRAAEYEPDEIEDSLQAIWNAPTPALMPPSESPSTFGGSTIC